MSARAACILLLWLGVCAVTGEAATRDRKPAKTSARAAGAAELTPTGGTLSLLDKSLSATVVKDGQPLTFGYYLSAETVPDAWLGAALLGPDSQSVTDPGSDKQIQPGSSPAWHYRDLLVNLAPGAATGLFDATWTVRWDESSQTAETSAGALTVEPALDVRIPILMYHKVGPVPHSSYWVSTANFEAHMKALKAYNYTTITLQELMNARAGLATLPSKPIVIAFDDGYRNNLTDAYPILARPDIDFKATLFLPTGKVGGTNAWDAGDNNPVIDHLTWEEVQTLHASGRFDIQSHTVSHPDMPAANDTDLASELTASRQEIQTRLNKTVRFVSWPYGANNLRTQVAAHAAGYFAAAAASGGVETDCRNKWALRRVEIESDVSTVLPADKFLMDMIGDPDVKVPAVQFGASTYLDPATNDPLPSDRLQQGSSVKIRLKVNNWGTDAPSVAILRIDDDLGTVYNSHLAVPEEDVETTLVWGANQLDWTWTAPANARPGQYYVSFEIHDPHYVLGFGQTNLRQAFTVVTGTEPQVGPRVAAVTPALATVQSGSQPLTQATVRFDSNVQIGSSDVTVVGAATGPRNDFVLSYEAATFTATLTWATPLANDVYTLTVKDTVQAVGGFALDGEQADPTHPSLPSGNGTAGGDFVGLIYRLAGDVTADGQVNDTDMQRLGTSWNTSQGQPDYDPVCDVTGDSRVDFRDVLVLSANWNQTIPMTP